MNKSTTVQEIRSIIKEIAVSQQETSKQIKQLSAETSERIKKLSKETDKLRASQKEASEQMKKQSAEADKRAKELDKQIKTTDRQIQKIGSRFNQRWGAFVESLISGNLLRMLQNWGINITQTHTRSEANWKKPDGSIQTREFDIIAANGKEVVAVEVKTTLSIKDIKKFLNTIKDFKNYFPRYKKETIYGAIAYLNSEDKAHTFAEEKGFFVIRATGDSATIINKKNFKPKVFA